MVATPITGTSKRMSCLGLATLTICAGAAEAGTSDDFVGPFHRSHRHHRLVLGGDGLADIEPAMASGIQ
jgi:hypothetical protein